MNKSILRKLIPALIPLVLLGIFLLCFVFPQYVPLLQVPIEKYEGLGSTSFTVEANTKGKPAKIAFVMKDVPAGTAPGGCNDIPNEVVVEKAFRIGESEVTAGLWSAIYKSSQSAGYLIGDRNPNGKFPQDDHPAVGVSWRDAIVWCNALSEALGLSPVYFDDEAFQKPIRSYLTLQYSNDRVFINPDAKGFRLPSADEWELAARYIDGKTWTPGGHPSGSPHPYYSVSRTRNYAIFNDIGTQKVKTLGPNRLGVYDMSGNVWEWNFDSFSNTDDENSSDAQKRVVRGGSWMSGPYRLQIGGRFGTLPYSIENGQGFRLAMNAQ